MFHTESIVVIPPLDRVLKRVAKIGTKICAFSFITINNVFPSSHLRRSQAIGPSVFFRDMRDCGRARHHMRDVSSVAVVRGADPSANASGSRHCTSNLSHSYCWHPSHSFRSIHSSHCPGWVTTWILNLVSLRVSACAFSVFVSCSLLVSCSSCSSILPHF